MARKSYDFIMGESYLDDYREYLIRKIYLSGYSERSTIGRLIHDGQSGSPFFSSTVPRGVQFDRDVGKIIATGRALDALYEHSRKQWVAVVVDKVCVLSNVLSLGDKASLVCVHPKSFNKVVSRGVRFIGRRVNPCVDMCR